MRKPIYSILLCLAGLLLAVACQPVIVDTPELRSAIEAKYGTQGVPAVASDSALPGTIRITLLTPPPVTIEPSLVPTVTPTPECVLVKGNIASDGRKLYHLPGMRNYDQVKIDEAAGEKTWCSEQAAIDAGWTKAGN